MVKFKAEDLLVAHYGCVLSHNANCSFNTIKYLYIFIYIYVYIERERERESSSISNCTKLNDLLTVICKDAVEPLKFVMTNKQTPWPVPASELYRPSDRRLSAKLVPTFAYRGCRVVSATDPYGHAREFAFSTGQCV
jgi:hypothetical protein